MVTTNCIKKWGYFIITQNQTRQNKIVTMYTIFKLEILKACTK